MSPTHETLVKKLVVFTSLVVLASSIGFLLVACGSESSARSAQPRAVSISGWHALPAAPIRVDAGLTSVWTGKEMIVSGVRSGPDGTFIGSTDVAAAYDPATRTWRRLADSPEKESFCRRAAVWTGKEMLVWGCDQVAFDPSTDRWRRLRRAPGGQGIVAWTGKEMIGWGGGCCGDANGDGSAYEPATDSWRKLAPSPLAPGQEPIGAWTGHELILLVSGFKDGKAVTGARAAAYDPATDTWRRIARLPESGLRFGGTAVWNGLEVLVVGAGAHGQAAFAYRPATNRWRRLRSSPRAGASAVWTGQRLMLWGGRDALAYDAKANRWSALPKAPLRRRDGSTVVWTGRALIVWGGVIGTPIGAVHPENYPKYLADGAAFTPTKP